MTADLLLPATVLVPLTLACLSVLARGHAVAVVGLVGTALSALPAVAVAVLVAVDGPVRHELAGWSPPLGIALRADGLSAVLLALTAVVGTATAVYAAARTTTYDDHRGFWPLALLLWAGMAAVLVGADLFNTYVALEVVTLAAVGLVALGGRASWGPALRYLLVAVLGSMFYLLAVAAIYGMTGTLDMAQAGAVIAADPTADTRWPMGLAVVGLGLKSALLPLHAWLPPAHASAPAAVSPLLSGLVVKAGFVVLVRLWFEVLGPDPAVAVLLACAAAAAVLVGGVLALVQSSLKRIVAYSTVAQIGYLFLLFPVTLGVEDPDLRASLVSGVLLLLLAHGLAKASLFLAAGSLQLAAGSDQLAEIVGAARQLRSTTAAMMLASISLAGLPISLGFSGKWLLLTGAVQTGQWWVVVLVVAGTLLSAAYLLRPLATVLLASDTTHEVEPVDLHALPPGLRHVPLVLALLVVLLGLNAEWLATLSVTGLPAGGAP
ncbi:complex I subunit 5 family protein [Ornithinimicrobium sufpigmenti]|uniref:complex I subunit 5 family protein n=1 Tax=Ornithinimicrobium sufpigmenti TaxID=2508882 RepID=UPI0010362FC4|nr:MULTISPECIES: proton-conducting transporter membrane subunit [unclassified Ornithinimicrobium]